MHYALPQRKSSYLPAYAIKPKKSLREQRRLFVIIGIGALALIFLLYRQLRSWPLGVEENPSKAPYGQPGVVVVTTINPGADPDFVEKIKANRIEYATKHGKVNQLTFWTLLTITIGYATFFPNTTQYPLVGSPKSWARVPAMRHALHLWPQTPYFFHIDDRTLIMNTDIKIEDHIMNKKKLESMMLVDIPIIPPDSVIKTFAGLKAEKIDLVICQDKDGLMPNAFILRRGEWANFFLDVWYDPLYRSYNFQKAERHALEHIVQ